tara:strand:- start:221 stop:589 length:369 start_codon:yes stop_codon:yes gene_type:complete
MTFEEIVERHAEKNEDIDGAELLKLVNEHKENNFTSLQINDTIFLYEPLDGEVLFHLINAAPMKEFVANIKEFLKVLADTKEYDSAITPISSDKIKSLVKRYLKKVVKIEGDWLTANLEGST